MNYFFVLSLLCLSYMWVNEASAVKTKAITVAVPFVSPAKKSAEERRNPKTLKNVRGKPSHTCKKCKKSFVHAATLVTHLRNNRSCQETEVIAMRGDKILAASQLNPLSNQIVQPNLSFDEHHKELKGSVISPDNYGLVIESRNNAYYRKQKPTVMFVRFCCFSCNFENRSTYEKDEKKTESACQSCNRRNHICLYCSDSFRQDSSVNGHIKKHASNDKASQHRRSYRGRVGVKYVPCSGDDNDNTAQEKKDRSQDIRSIHSNKTNNSTCTHDHSISTHVMIFSSNKDNSLEKQNTHSLKGWNSATSPIQNLAIYNGNPRDETIPSAIQLNPMSGQIDQSSLSPEECCREVNEFFRDHNTFLPFVTIKTDSTQ